MNSAAENPSRARWLASPVTLAVLIGFLVGMFSERIYRAQLEKKKSAPAPGSIPTSAKVIPDRVANPEQPEVLMPLMTTNLFARQEVVTGFVQRKDARIISPLILLTWAASAGLVPKLTAEEIKSLQTITGQKFTDDWGQWAEWWWSQDAPPAHPGFALLQASLFNAIDPAFAVILYPELRTKIRRDEIIWSGAHFDGIPALINPACVNANSSEATVYRDDEPVFGVFFSGEARAYPLRILDWHEMANDAVGEQRFFISYCALCGAAVAYDSYVEGMGRFVFGTSGLLRRGNKLMYDRQSKTLWSAMEGRPILGPLAVANPNWQLQRLPIVRTSWGEWKRLHPKTTVLSLETSYRREYAPGQPFGEYYASPDTLFPIGQRSSALKAKDWTYGLLIEGKAKAYPVKAFEASPVLMDEFAGRKLLLLGHAGRLEVRAYESDGRAFDWKIETTALTERGTDRTWRLEEDAVVGPNGEKFRRLPGNLAYWFGWYAAFEQTEIFRPPKAAPAP